MGTKRANGRRSTFFAIGSVGAAVSLAVELKVLGFPMPWELASKDAVAANTVQIDSCCRQLKELKEGQQRIVNLLLKGVHNVAVQPSTARRASTTSP